MDGVEEETNKTVENSCFLCPKLIPIVKFDSDKENMKYSVNDFQGFEISTSSTKNFCSTIDFVTAQYDFQTCLSFLNKQKAR